MNQKWLPILFLVIFQTFKDVVSQQTATVATEQGRVIGSVVVDGLTTYNVFYGIPYAGNPSGTNRFKPPPPAQNFPGDFHAHNPEIICAQPSRRGAIGVEDCLVLSIYSLNLTASSPVLVILDSEDYASSTSFTQSYTGLVEQGNVVVKLNYRLSVLGFLCLGIDEAPGNAGLYDVIAGLKWIYQNIGGFGGNPENIVLFGHGSGAAMVDLVTLSPLSVGLVHKAIVSSGSALAPWAISYTPVENAQTLGNAMNHNGQTKEELAKFLVDADLNILIQSVNLFSFYNNTILFAPCIENVALKSNGTFLPDSPINILRSGNYRQIPYITGYVNREGTVRAGQALYDSWLDKLNASFVDFLQPDLTFTTEENRTAVAQNIRNFYFASSPITMASIEDYLDYFGDTLFVVSIIRGARERAATSSAPVRLYQFEYRGTKNSDWAFNILLTGARHGSILNYLFDYDLTANDASVRSSLLKRWTGFAATGAPTTPNNDMVDWPAVGSNLIHLIYSGGEVAPNQSTFGESTGINPHLQMMTFWNNIYDTHYVAPKSVGSNANLVRTSMSLLAFVLMLFFA